MEKKEEKKRARKSTMVGPEKTSTAELPKPALVSVEKVQKKGQVEDPKKSVKINKTTKDIEDKDLGKDQVYEQTPDEALLDKERLELVAQANRATLLQTLSVNTTLKMIDLSANMIPRNVLELFDAALRFPEVETNKLRNGLIYLNFDVRYSISLIHFLGQCARCF